MIILWAVLYATEFDGLAGHSDGQGVRRLATSPHFVMLFSTPLVSISGWLDTAQLLSISSARGFPYHPDVLNTIASV